MTTKKKQSTHSSRVIRLTKETTNELKQAADVEKRSLKNYIEVKLTELAANGTVNI